MASNPSPSSVYELTRPVGYQLVTGVLQEMAPDELSLMRYVIDDLYSAAEHGTPVSASNERAFGLGGSELLALVVIPLIVNVVSDLVSDYLKQRAFRPLSTDEIRQTASECGVLLGDKEARGIQVQVDSLSRAKAPVIAESLRAVLRQLLISRFNEGELKDLVFDLGGDWDVLPGDAKGDKVRELILLMERRNALMTLLAHVQMMRPDIPLIIELTTFDRERKS